jgi:uncharacterized protein (AIM24 family)
MKYEMIGKTVPAVEVELGAGEAMFTQSGAMAWMDRSFLRIRDGRWHVRGLEKVSGESLFMVTYASSREGQDRFASTYQERSWMWISREMEV